VILRSICLPRQVTQFCTITFILRQSHPSLTAISIRPTLFSPHVCLRHADDWLVYSARRFSICELWYLQLSGQLLNKHHNLNGLGCLWRLGHWKRKASYIPDTWWLSRNLYLGSGIEDKFVVYSLSICQQPEHIPGKGNHKSRRGPDFPVEEGVFSTSSFRSLLLPSCKGGYNTTAAFASDSTRFDAPSLSFPLHSERCPVDGSSNAC
jgi:hypothetical protein